MFKLTGVSLDGLEKTSICVMRTIMGAIELVTSEGFVSHDAIPWEYEPRWVYIRKESPALQYPLLNGYQMVVIHPIDTMFLNGYLDWSNIVEKCNEVLEEQIAEGYLLDTLKRKVNMCSFKDIDIVFGDITKMEFILDTVEKMIIRSTYPEYVEFLLGGE